MPNPPQTVDLLILGAGWTSTFLIPLCKSRNIPYAATSRPGSPKPDTILFEYDPTSDDPNPYNVLPHAKTVVITFPIKVKGGSGRLVKLYEQTHASETRTGFIQLGSTGIWDGGPTLDGKPQSKWFDRHSPFNTSNDRAAAETKLLDLSPESHTTVLNLSGLWGGQRALKHWVGKVAPTKEVLKNKGSIHMIHGEDVSRAILAVHGNFEPAIGQRWILTDQRVYDWWDLASAWGETESKEKSQSEESGSNGDEGRGPQARWVRELMVETGVRALPRSPEQMVGRALDSREFWDTFKVEPVRARLE
ncbi:unnamed protein product [Somion occarium]|uniref:Uncharacterized protein n=1 Tax=Somion occarium TaxID=3059160 RepID=A0ABP1ECK0_9APHY